MGAKNVIKTESLFLYFQYKIEKREESEEEEEDDDDDFMSTKKKDGAPDDPMARELFNFQTSKFFMLIFFLLFSIRHIHRGIG